MAKYWTASRTGADRMDQPFEAQLRATLNVIPAYTWYAGPAGALTFVNERSAEYLGLPKDHPLRLGIETGAAWDSHLPMLHPDDREATRKVWSDCLRTGSPGEATFGVGSTSMSKSGSKPKSNFAAARPTWRMQRGSVAPGSLGWRQVRGGFSGLRKPRVSTAT